MRSLTEAGGRAGHVCQPAWCREARIPLEPTLGAGSTTRGGRVTSRRERMEGGGDHEWGPVGPTRQGVPLP